MKRLITAIFVFLLLASIVSAQGQNNKPETAGQPEETGQDVAPQQIRAEEQAEAGNGLGEQIRARNRERLETGLQNALSRVKNENARQRLQANLEKFQLRYQERMQRMEDVEVEEVDDETGAVTVRAKEQVRFFGFIKGRATKRFNINAQGAIEEKAPWYRFMYAEEE